MSLVSAGMKAVARTWTVWNAAIVRAFGSVSARPFSAIPGMKTTETFGIYPARQFALYQWGMAGGNEQRLISAGKKDWLNVGYVIRLYHSRDRYELVFRSLKDFSLEKLLFKEFTP